MTTTPSPFHRIVLIGAVGYHELFFIPSEIRIICLLAVNARCVRLLHHSLYEASHSFSFTLRIPLVGHPEAPAVPVCVQPSVTQIQITLLSIRRLLIHQCETRLSLEEKQEHSNHHHAINRKHF